MIGPIAGVLADTDGWDGHMGWGGGWWMLIFSTMMMAGFVVLVVWLIRSANTGGGRPAHGQDPLASARQILAERYARGELSTDEYQEHLEELARR